VHTLSGSIVADFRADVEVDGESEEIPDRTRVVVSERKLGIEADGRKRVIDLSDVFDVVQGVSRLRRAGATETVTLAFRADGRRSTVSISASVETMVRFQQVLYAQLLNGTALVVQCRDRSGVGERGPYDGTLLIDASRIRFRPDGTADPIVIRRDDVIKFKTPSTAAGGGDHEPVVVIYADTGGRVLKTTATMPSFRILNLFGRYLRADLLSVDAIGAAPRRRESVELLLVDDDPHDREMAEVFLGEQSDRFSMTTTATAADGLDVLKRESKAAGIDCIVSDYRMPGMDGIEFLNGVRERYPELPFILYTGQGSEAVAKQAILDDATDYVEKDVGREQYEVLAERIRKAVRP